MRGLYKNSLRERRSLSWHALGMGMAGLLGGVLSMAPAQAVQTVAMAPSWSATVNRAIATFDSAADTP
jgi:hypothetical protein